MSNAKFVADVRQFGIDAEAAMLRVAKQSIQDVISIAQTPVAQGGNMPVDTGFLRNSLVSSLDGAKVGEGEIGTTLAIAGLEIGNAIQFAWTADYAIPRHYAVGVGQGGGLWRDKAAQQWEQIVRTNAAKVAT